MIDKRINFWIISCIVCIIVFKFIEFYNGFLPEEERTPVNYYCDSMFKEKMLELLKKKFDKAKYGYNHKPVFVDSIDDADIILTENVDEVKNIEMQRIGWSPLIVAVSSNSEKQKNYTENGYIYSNSNGEAIMNFSLIIDDTLSGKWVDKIYCPRADSKEGEIFRKFLLVTVNGGSYPNDEELMKFANSKVEKFLGSEVIFEMDDTADWLHKKNTLESEICVFFENELTSAIEDNVLIVFPRDTVIRQWYYCLKNDDYELMNIIERKDFWNSYNTIDQILSYNNIRFNVHSGSFFVNVPNSFSYADIPSGSSLDVVIEEE